MKIKVIHLSRKGVKHTLKTDEEKNWCFDDIWLGKEVNREEIEDSPNPSKAGQP